ncbi:MAG: hypothetical protein K2X86_12125 [Cytophagaceae bacterium]|nr:hypothetical protein [Cytophagaceae bacterium]
MGTGKRFMAYEMVRRLEKRKEYSLLKQLSEGVEENERRRGKKHQVFAPSFDVKICDSEIMIEQKLDYMHNNPVSGKWNLVNDYTDYKHSSAAFYELGKSGVFDVKHYKEINYAESPTGDSAAK